MRGKKKVRNEETLETGEEETIALSTDELDDILSEAEIVQEKPKGKKEVAFPEVAEGDIDIPVAEEEFDISGEIDELTPEDLENIELEESEIESFSKELEEELGEELELPEGTPDEEVVVVSDEELSEELEGIDTEEISLEEEIETPEVETVSVESEAETLVELDTEAETVEEIDEVGLDIDSLLESGGEEIDIDNLDLGEEAVEEEIGEPPMLGEDELSAGVEADEAFKEAGIEGIDEETVSLDDVDLEAIEEISLDEELPSEGEEAGEVTIDELTEVDLPIEEVGELPEELMEEAVESAEAAEQPVEELPEESFDAGIELNEEEEKILSEDFDLTAGVEELPEDEVVTVTGEELEALGEEPTGGGVDAALLNDITTILKFMDTLLGDLPEDKIKEFAQSEYFPLYKEVFEKLNLA
jgi:hypothetical protein